MMFQSILFESTEDSIKKETVEAPAFFVDLHLDQIIDAITASKQEYNLKPLYYTPLKDISVIKYRQEIARDLENETLLDNIRLFALKMIIMRRNLALIEKLKYKYQKEVWFLEAVETYCDAVNCLIHDLSLADLKSRGLLAFHEYLTYYVNSDRFTSIFAKTKKLIADLSTIKYCVMMGSNWAKVRKYEYEIDYSPELERTFEKFKQGAVKDYTVTRFLGAAVNQLEAEILDFEKFKQGVVKDYTVARFLGPAMNQVEAGILDLVAKLYPDIFSSLNNYCTECTNYLDETISVFDREIQFYVAYLEYIATIKQVGLKFCYPQISIDSKEIYNYEGFNLALAYKRVTENFSIVFNDFYLKGKERIFVVSGPDQGGKTTFARTFGQLHYLASLGCPIPGREAQLFLCDRLFVCFEKEENIEDLRGKLEDDLVRAYDILNQATSNSIVIINKLFTSTTRQDATFLSKKLIEKIMQLDLLCVLLTSVEELASFSEKTVSMISLVVPENPTLRTYKIVRGPADGLSYAISIAEKYRLTYDCLKERIIS
ncbi:DNA mismatch repair protein MutS [Chloroflexota bacterium]